jgi:ubiquinone/menaquinone biosynthesis C-methylase UbiE
LGYLGGCNTLGNNNGGVIVGNTDKFEMIANIYDTSERVQIAKVSSDAIREYLVDAKSKDAIDFGCGTGLVGMDLLNEFKSILFLDTSQNMINQVKQKISDANIHNASTLCFDFETATLSSIRADYIFMAQVLLHIKNIESVLSRLYDILNFEGHLIIVDFNKNDDIVSDMVHNGFDQKKLSDIMLKIGYKDIQTKTFYSGSKIFMGHDASLFVLDSQKC